MGMLQPVIGPVLKPVLSPNIVGAGGGAVEPKFKKLLGLRLWTHLGSATFARASAATVEDFEGNVIAVKVDEARFQGARRVENKAIEQDVTQWSVQTQVVITPMGNNEFRVQGTGAWRIADSIATFEPNNNISTSIWVRSYDGTPQPFAIRSANNNSPSGLTALADWNRFQRIRTEVNRGQHRS